MSQADAHDDRYDDADEMEEEIMEEHVSATTATTTGMITAPPPSLYTRPTYFRQTRRGKIFKTVTERYLREDLGFGFHYNNSNSSKTTTEASCAADAAVPLVIESVHELMSLLLQPHHHSTSTTTSTSFLVVCDTNVLLHNLDLLEQITAMMNHNNTMPSSSFSIHLVIPQTSLLETRKHSIVAYERVVALLNQQQQQSQTTTTTTQSPSNSNRCTFFFFADLHHVETAVVDDERHNNNASFVSPNDLNDARIRRVAEFYARHLLHNTKKHNTTTTTKIRVIFLSDDAASRRQFQSWIVSSLSSLSSSSSTCCQALSVREWVHELEKDNPQQQGMMALSDWVAQLDSTTTTASDSKLSTSLPPTFFDAHLDAATLARGVQSGKYHRGVLRSSNFEDEMSSWVTIRRGDERVAVTIFGKSNKNRAVDGDVVAIALNPLDQWITAASASSVADKKQQLKHSNNNDNNNMSSASSAVATTTAIGGGGAGIASDTAAPTLSELENVQDKIAVGNGGDNDSSSLLLLRPTGRVIGILRRNFPTLSGSILLLASSTASGGDDDNTAKDASSSSLISLPEHKSKMAVAAQYEKEHADGSTTCVFFPVDKKFPPVIIRTTQRDRLLTQRIVVSMDSWPPNSPFPLGHYVRTIGPAGSKDVETQVLLEQHNIPYEPFPASVLSCLPSGDFKIECTKDRTDLRHLPVLSIDPPNCKDIDDALHCVPLPNGNWQVGVHIADVTHYVKAGSAMDLEAANRSTSTYLVNRRLDMLPGLLTTDLCSLKSNVDRYAFSVLWEVTPDDAQIVKVDFQKSVIHSIAALTYQQAQSMIEQPDDPNDIQACAVKRLAVLARQFRKRRVDAGALTLASPEVKFVLDSESLNPTDVQAYALLEANALVEEFMLLANVTVSKKILRQYPTLSVLRRHPSPNRSMFDGLISKARCRGFELDIEDSKRLADSLDAAVDESDPYINKLLRILSTRCMSPAQYFCSGEFKPHDWHHYGLAAPVYTHFTSPIRRYADVCVHRLLAAAIGVAPLPQQFANKSYLHDLCANMNRRHRAAQLAGRASVQLHTLIFFAGDGAKEEDAYVLDVDTTTTTAATNPSFTVMVPQYGIEGRVKLTSLVKAEDDDPELELFPAQHKIVYRHQTSIQVFDKVRVRIWVREFEDHQRELVLDLVSPQFGVNNDAGPAAGGREAAQKHPRDPSLDDDSAATAPTRDTKKRKIS